MDQALKKEHPIRWLALIFAVLAAGIVTAGILHYRSYERHHRAEVERQLSAIAKLKVGELAQWRKGRLADGSVLYKNPALTALVRRVLKAPEDADAHRQLQIWLDKIQANYDYNRIVLLDTRGTTRLSTSKTPEPDCALVVQRIREIAQGHVAILDFHRDAPDHPIHLGVLVPIRDDPDGDQPLGVLVLRIDPTIYLYPFIQRWPTPSQTAETQLIRRDGDDALFLNELRFRKNSALSLRAPLSRTEQPAVQAALGREGPVEGPDYRGVPVIADARAVPDSPWLLVARMDAAEVYAPLKDRLWTIIALVVVLLFGTGGSLGLVFRQQRFRFNRERAETAEALRQSDERARILFEQAGDIILQLELMPEGMPVIREANSAASRLLGFERNELIGQSVSFIEAAPDASKVIEKRRQNILSEMGKTFEVRHRCKDGTIRDFECSVTEMQIGSKTYAISVERDITERKQAEKALAASDAQKQGISLLQRSLLAPAPLADKLKTVTDSIVRLFNADFCRIWMIRSGDLCQQDCIHAEAKEGPHVCRYRDRCLHLLASSGRYTHTDGKGHRRVPFGCYKIGLVASGEQHKFITNDAQNDPRVHNHAWTRELGLVSFAGYQIRVPGGQTMGVLALFAQHPIAPAEDSVLDGLSSTVAHVIQQSVAEEALREAKEEAETATRAKSEFLARMSHELRTPLNSVIGFTKILLKNKAGHLDAPELDHLDRVRTNGIHLLGLINDILDLSKVEAGRMSVEVGFLSLDVLVRETLAQLEGQAHTRQVRLLSELPPALAPLMTDATKLRQILINLVGNAIKFADKGAVTVRVVADPKTSVPTRIDVIDTGIGIPSDRLGRIFEAFEQADSSTSRKYGGTGLGLAICRSFCRMLGYSIQVRSEVGTGSTFSILLSPDSGADSPPAGAVTSAAAGVDGGRGAPPPPPDTPMQARRILVIDDNADERRLIVHSLARDGCEIREAAEGSEALSVLKHDAPDLILLDLDMPGMDGLAFLAELRRDPLARQIPVVVMTDRSLSPEEARRLSSEARMVLKKGESGLESVRRSLDDILKQPAPPSPPRTHDAIGLPVSAATAQRIVKTGGRSP